jgi:hypothetical protein
VDVQGLSTVLIEQWSITVEDETELAPITGADTTWRDLHRPGDHGPVRLEPQWAEGSTRISTIRIGAIRIGTIRIGTIRISAIRISAIRISAIRITRLLIVGVLIVGVLIARVRVGFHVGRAGAGGRDRRSRRHRGRCQARRE